MVANGRSRQIAFRYPEMLANMADISLPMGSSAIFASFPDHKTQLSLHKRHRHLFDFKEVGQDEALRATRVGFFWFFLKQISASTSSSASLSSS